MSGKFVESFAQGRRTFNHATRTSNARGLVKALPHLLLLLLALLSSAAPGNPTVDRADSTATETAELELIKACMVGDVEAVPALIEGKPNLEVRDSKMHWTPLMWASNATNTGSTAQRAAEVVKLLLDAGADVNSEDPAHQTPLTLAIRAKSRETVDLLLSKGADAFHIGSMHDTLLQDAVGVSNTYAVKKLLDLGVGVNAANAVGSTPLHYASICSNPEIASILIKAGAGVNTLDQDGESPLLSAVWAPKSRKSFIETKKCPDVTATVKILLEGGAVVDDASAKAAADEGLKDILELFRRQKHSKRR